MGGAAITIARSRKVSAISHTDCLALRDSFKTSTAPPHALTMMSRRLVVISLVAGEVELSRVDVARDAVEALANAYDPALGCRAPRRDASYCSSATSALAAYALAPRDCAAAAAELAASLRFQRDDGLVPAVSWPSVVKKEDPRPFYSLKAWNASGVLNAPAAPVAALPAARAEIVFP